MKVFGTDGIRDIANKLYERAFALGCAFQNKRVVVGRDVRLSSPIIEKYLLKGLINVGAQITVVGIVPTPMLAYIVDCTGADFGIMITASHNPPCYNGLKVFASGGKKLSTLQEQILDEKVYKLLTDNVANGDDNRLRLLEKAGNQFCQDAHNKSVDVFLEGKGKYIKHVLALFENLDLSGEKIYLDCAYGCMAIVPAVFERLGAEVVEFNSNYDGSKVNVNCGAICVEQFASKVPMSSIGFSFDGDGDRVIAVVDGKVYDGDRILNALAEYLDSKQQLAQKSVVGTMMTGGEIESNLKAKGITLYRTDVGDKYVSDKMQEVGAILGGEKSGHIIQSNLSPTGDGLLTALSLLKAKQYFGTLPYIQPNNFYDFPYYCNNPKQVFCEEWFTQAINEICAKIGDKGRLIARPSGTEALIRITIEQYDSGLECRKIIKNSALFKNLQKCK